MPNQLDSRQRARAVSDRASPEANPREKAPGGDPLADLARILSGPGNGGGSNVTQARRRTVPATAEVAKPAPPPDILGDLEAELLSNLQASLSEIRGDQSATSRNEAEPPPSSPPPSEPPPEAEAPSATAAMPQPRAAEPAAPATRLNGPRAVGLRTQRENGQAAPAAAERRGSAPPVPSEPVADARPDTSVAQPPNPPPEQNVAAVPRPPARPAAPSDSVDIPNMQLRARAPHQPHSRWDKPPEHDESLSSAASRFAPPRGATPPPVPVESLISDDADELLGDGFPFGQAADEEANEADVQLDELGLDEGQGDEEEAPFYPEDEFESLIERRPGRGRIALAAVLVMIAVGGGLLFMFRAGPGDSAPPIITADGSPIKILPEDNGSVENDQNKLIYDRVASGESEPDTTLITPGDEPIAEIAPADADTDNPISRVIIPGGPGIDRPTSAAPDRPADIGSMIEASETPPAATDNEPIEPIGPRKVRTVVVKPDGTIVSNEVAEARPDTTPSPAENAPDVVESTPVAAAPRPPATDNDTMAIAGAGGGTDANGELAITPVPNPADGGDVAVVDIGAEPPAPLPAPPSPPAPRAVATAEGQPIDLTPPRASLPRAAEPTKTTVAAVTNGTLVQVSSQRSEDAARATFRDLQARYPGILGGYEVNIQRANLGERGIFYRARVGPFSPGDAERLCNDLKAAGGDCILARR